VDPWGMLTEAFGPLHWERQPPQQYVREDHQARVQYRGTELIIRRYCSAGTTARGGRSTQYHWHTVLSTSYAPRPLLLSLSPRHIGWPRLPTGDPAFEQHFRLAGAPQELLLQVFADPGLRGRLLAAPLRPYVYGEHGIFEHDVDAIVEDGGGGPEHLRAVADVLVEVTQRLCGELDRQYAEVAAQSGPAAAEAWLQQQAAAAVAVEQARGRLKNLILVLVLVGVVLMMVAIIAISW